MNPRPVVTVLCEPADDHPAHLEELADRLEFRFVDRAGLGDALPGADVLFLWDFFSDALADHWDRCDRLRWIHVAAAGVDKLYFDELRASDITVTNAHGIFDRPIAEFVLASVFAHGKRLHETWDLQTRREWVHRETGTLTGRTALVIGTGGIGREIARLLRAAGLRVRGAGRTARTGDPDFGDVVPSAELAAHVGDVDYLVNAAPLTPATTGLVDDAVLRALPARAHLVNIGRGPTVVEADLLAALDRGGLDGASLDVVETEPLPADSPLWSAPGVVISPHMSGDVVGWKDALARQFVTNARAWLAGEPLANVVDNARGYVPSRVG